MKSKALLFGINYINTPESRLRGCVNDVKNMSAYLTTVAKYDVVDSFTDEDDYESVTARSISRSMYNLAVQSHRHRLERVWIHFSGHGTSIRDKNGDESDKKDECILPADYKKVGVITDDNIKRFLNMFHKDTRVVCIFDCCHSGTIGDLPYKYDHRSYSFENTQNNCKANVILISGCKDHQTSADAYNVNYKHSFSGAMTSCLLLALKNYNSPKLFDILDDLRSFLKTKKYLQIPQLTSNFIIDDAFELK